MMQPVQSHSGDGTVGLPEAWTLAIPQADRALRLPGSEPGPGTAERASRRVLRLCLALAALGVLFSALVPLTRTVRLDGQLMPERVVTLRAGETGLVERVLVAAGDTVTPGALVAQLRSPSLDEAFRSSFDSPVGSRHNPDAALLARLTRLAVEAPPWAERRPNGSADPATFFSGGVVLTEDLGRLRGAHLDAGDAVLDLAPTDASGDVPLVVRAWADEQAAQRIRPGMTARLTVPALPQERARQTVGTVTRVGPSPDPTANSEPGTRQADARRWRIEVAVDPLAVRALTQPASGDRPARLRSGFAVEVAVEERRETIARTVLRWIETRTKGG